MLRKHYNKQKEPQKKDENDSDNEDDVADAGAVNDQVKQAVEVAESKMQLH